MVSAWQSRPPQLLWLLVVAIVVGALAADSASAATLDVASLPYQQSLEMCKDIVHSVVWTEAIRVQDSVGQVVRLQEMLDLLGGRKTAELADTMALLETCLARLYIQHRDSSAGNTLLSQARVLLERAVKTESVLPHAAFTLGVLHQVELPAQNRETEEGLRMPLTSEEEKHFKDSLTWLRVAAEAGHGGAQYRMAKVLTEGYEGIQESNVHLAYYYIHEAAKQEVRLAQLEIALLLIQGAITEDTQGRVVELAAEKRTDVVGERQRYSRAVFWLREAAKGNLPVAWFYLARMAEKGAGMVAQPTLARAFYKNAAEMGHAAAAHALGLDHYSRKNEEGEMEKALYWLRISANAGHLPAMTDFSFFLIEWGRVEEGVTMLYSAAESGFLPAMHTLASYLYHGQHGVRPDPEAAVRIWKSAGNSGHGQSLLAYATALDEGVQVPRNASEAAAIYLRLMPETNGLVAMRLGTLYMSADLEDCDGAMQWMTVAARLEQPPAYLGLATLYSKGECTARNDTAAVFWLLKASQHDETFAQAVAQLQHGRATDGRPYRQVAFGMLLKRARKGDAQAQLDVGLTLAAGCDECRVTKDDKKAMRWFHAAAEQGDAVAMYNMALFLHEGRVGHVDRQQALQWLVKAANLRHVTSMRFLGFYYKMGDVVEADVEMALHWFWLAAKEGDAPSQYEAANILRGLRVVDGKDVSRQTDVEARKLLKEAAWNGHEPAQVEYAHRLNRGEGQDRDISQALYWFLLRAHAGDHACEYEAGLLLLNGYEPAVPAGARSLPGEPWTGTGEEHGIYWMQRAADRGHSEALSVISAIAIQRSTNRSHHLAVVAELLANVDVFTDG